MHQKEIMTKLLTQSECIQEIFSEGSRPCARTWISWKKRRVVPFVRIGRLHFYDPEAVRAALASKFTVVEARDVAAD
jgi:hypothetical protein